MRRRIRAFALIKTDLGDVENVSDNLMKFEEVKEVHMITGEWDLLTVLEFDRDVILPSGRSVLYFVVNTLQKVKGVKGTSTILTEFSRTKFAESQT